jgi:CRISPR/Cas system CSM-associated protein Csm3 (group 7 of RAMP superfamily)
MATWLDDQYKQRQGIEVENLEPFNPDASFGKQNFVVSMTLQIPRGQDFLVSEGADMSPMQRTNVAGEQHWIIPGSTLRGLFRAWFSRLAAKDGKLKYDTHKVPIGKPDLLGWAGKESKDDRKEFQENPDALGDSILSLFGSMYAKGRIHISDAISKQPATTEATQKRMHVAIDRFSGGANEGALFENSVLTSESGLDFPCTISIADPKPDEVKWLAQTLKALNLGLIRIGSSKASGRLTVKDFTLDAADEKLINMFNNNYKGGK